MGRTPMEPDAPDSFVWVIADVFLAAMACLAVAAVVLEMTRFAGFRRRQQVPLPFGFRSILGSGLGLLPTDVRFVLLLIGYHAREGAR